jgi:hypothetical protein
MSLNTQLSRLALATGVFASVLTACGGGGAESSLGPTVSANSYTLQTYITDNLATEYAKVWVSIKKITAVDSTGAEVTLFDGSTSPATVNLSSLAAVGQFLASVSLPAGIYSQVKVTLGNAVQLVSLDGGTTISAKFSADGSDLVLSIRDIDLNPAVSGQLVLDFNLAKFNYDATTGIVTPVVEHPKPADAFGKFIRQEAEVHGTVDSVNASAGSFTVTDAHLGGAVIVSLASDATLVNEQTQAKLSLSDLPVGAVVELRGTVKPGATTADPATVTASVVHVLPAGSTGHGVPGALRLSGSGSITAVTGSKVTVSLSDANFLPSSNSVVVDIGSARFTHGQASDVTVGLKVHFVGLASGSGSSATISASVFDIEGASSSGNGGGKFAGAVNGKVASVASAQSFTLTVTTGTAAVPAGTYTVDASHAEYEAGSSTCLVVGAQLHLRGTVSGSTLTAKEIEIDGCAGQGHSAPGHD